MEECSFRKPENRLLETEFGTKRERGLQKKWVKHQFVIFTVGETIKNDMGETRTPAGNEKSEQNCSRISNERKHPLEPSLCVCVCVCV